jgi:hypothetical protein
MRGDMLAPMSPRSDFAEAAADELRDRGVSLFGVFTLDA